MPRRGSRGWWSCVLTVCLCLGLTAAARGQAGGAGQAGAPPHLGPLAQAQIASRLGVTRWTLRELEPLAAPGAGEINLRVPLGEEQHDIVLVPHSVRGENFRVLLCRGDGTLIPVPAPQETTWRGRIPGLPTARIAATVENGRVSAMIVLDADRHLHGEAEPESTWFIQPLSAAIEDAPATMHIIYSGAAAPPDGHVCGGGLKTFLPGPAGGPGGVRGGGGGGPDNTVICRIAVDADYKFYQQNDSSTSATINDISAVINNSSLIYEAESNVSFELTEVIVRTTNWPYISGVMSSNLLNQFRNHWNANHSSVPRDIAHLFTGITTSDSSIIGLAWVGVVCNQSLAYGYSRSRYTTNMSRRTGLTAHEIGHNFSADHCNESGGVCSPCNIMCSSIGGCGGNSGSLGCSAGVIADYAASAGCLATGCIGPNITAQPQSRSVEAGQSVQLSIGAGGTGPLTYRWRRDGVNLNNGGGISGATTDTLTINPVAVGHAGDYTCVVSSPCGARTSNVAVLSVTSCDPPAITGQPEARHVAIGGEAVFAVTATGDGLSYQWRRNGGHLSNGGGVSGANSAVLRIDPVATSHAGDYTCLITGQCGQVESSAAALVITDCTPPAVTVQPQSRAVPLGSGVQLAITAGGDGPLHYQWQRDGANLANSQVVAGVHTPTLTIDPVAVGHGGTYRCIVTNDCGQAVSSGAALTVVIPPVITANPAHADGCAGERIVLNVGAGGTGPLAYQWRRDGVYLGPAPNRSGVNSATLIIEPASTSDSGLYTVEVSNSAGVITSQPALVTVRPGTTISQQPQSSTIAAGKRARFVVGTAGLAPTAYRWRKDGQDLQDSDTIFGASTPTLTINPTQPADAGQYTLRIEHACGITMSAAATLAITAPEPSTIAYWRFEEGRNGDGSPGAMRHSGRAISEVSSPALDAHRYRGDPRYTTDTPGAEIDGIGSNTLALEFRGEEALRTSASSLLDFGPVASPGGQFTIELFVKIDPVSNDEDTYPIIHKSAGAGSSTTGYLAWVWAGGAHSSQAGRAAVLQADSAGRVDYLSSARLDDGHWHHLAWRRYDDGQSVRTDVWIDYHLQGTVSGEASGDLASLADFIIGRNGDAYLEGKLDEIRISDRPLHPWEFLRTVQGGSCYADCDRLGGAAGLSASDFTCFVNQFTIAQSLPHAQQVEHYANCDGSTVAPVLNIDDFACFMARFAAGCR